MKKYIIILLVVALIALVYIFGGNKINQFGGYAPAPLSSEEDIKRQLELNTASSSQKFTPAPLHKGEPQKVESKQQEYPPAPLSTDLKK